MYLLHIRFGHPGCHETGNNIVPEFEREILSVFEKWLFVPPPPQKHKKNNPQVLQAKQKAFY